MKKKILVLALAALTLYSCNNDDNTLAVNTNAQNLYKTIKYSPSEAAYLSGTAGSLKQVQYFEDNQAVADTMYNALGNVELIYAHSLEDNMHTIEIKDGSYAVNAKKIHTYDNAGRLVEQKSILYNSGMPYNPTSIQTYTYNDDGSITKSHVDPDTNLVSLQYHYYTNSSGLIDNIEYLSDAESVIIYQTDRPVSHQYYNGSEWLSVLSFTYYETPVPENQTKTATEINNTVLLGREEEIAENCNFHLKSYVDHVQYNKTFDANGYVLYCHATGTIFEELKDSETFYFYE